LWQIGNYKIVYMVKIIGFFWALILTIPCLAQDLRHGEEWIFGVNLVKGNFANTLATTSALWNNTGGITHGYSSLADTNGKLRVICNGFYIADSNGKLVGIADGTFDSINCPFGTKFRDHFQGDGRYAQMSLILPKQGNTYYVFTTGMTDSAYIVANGGLNPDSFAFDQLCYHVVNMDSNAGAGKILCKNVVLSRGQRLSHYSMQAVKHGNGKDYWLVKQLKDRHEFLIWLVSADTIIGPTYQSFPLPQMPWALYGQSKFSEDGNYFAFCNNNYQNEIHLYDFDRCTGTLSNYKLLHIPYDSVTSPIDDWVTGLSFSPNNRYLYANTYFNLYQIDLQALADSPVHIAYYGANSAQFFNSNTAINGKIYIGNFHGVWQSMATIDSPNNKGLACSYDSAGFSTPFTNLQSVPNICNYGLGKVNLGTAYDGCWPLAIDTTVELAASSTILYPNPATDYIMLQTAQAAVLSITNMQGQVLLQHTVQGSAVPQRISLPAYTNGVYFYTIALSNGTCKAGKLLLWQ
jgi:hypothetical protein